MGGGGRDAAWNSTVALFAIAIARGCGLRRPQWLPAALVFGSIGVVAYADFIVTSISLGYLYILPLGIGAMFLRSQISYGLIAVCVFLHDVFGPLIQARKHGLHTISRRSSGSPLSST